MRVAFIPGMPFQITGAALAESTLTTQMAIRSRLLRDSSAGTGSGLSGRRISGFQLSTGEVLAGRRRVRPGHRGLPMS